MKVNLFDVGHQQHNNSSSNNNNPNSSSSRNNDNSNNNNSLADCPCRGSVDEAEFTNYELQYHLTQRIVAEFDRETYRQDLIMTLVQQVTP